MQKKPYSVCSRVYRRIKGKGSGSVVVTNDFLDLASRDTIKKYLLRLKEEGKLKRLIPGVYYYAKFNDLLGIELSPAIDKIAFAIARKNKLNILFSESIAANLLGLTTQVPANHVFLTNGKTKNIKVGKRTIRLKHASPKVMALGKYKGGIVVQAFKYFGEDRITSDIINKLKTNLPQKVKAELLRCIPFASDWMRTYLEEIADKGD